MFTTNCLFILHVHHKLFIDTACSPQTVYLYRMFTTNSTIHCDSLAMHIIRTNSPVTLTDTELSPWINSLYHPYNNLVFQQRYILATIAT